MMIVVIALQQIYILVCNSAWGKGEGSGCVLYVEYNVFMWSIFKAIITYFLQYSKKKLCFKITEITRFKKFSFIKSCCNQYFYTKHLIKWLCMKKSRLLWWSHKELSQTLQFFSALWSFIATLNSLFWFVDPQFHSVLAIRDQ